MHTEAGQEKGKSSPDLVQEKNDDILISELLIGNGFEIGLSGGELEFLNPEK